jgi:hypothetical protein
LYALRTHPQVRIPNLEPQEYQKPLLRGELYAIR